MGRHFGVHLTVTPLERHRGHCFAVTPHLLLRWVSSWVSLRNTTHRYSAGVSRGRRFGVHLTFYLAGVSTGVMLRSTPHLFSAGCYRGRRFGVPHTVTPLRFIVGVALLYTSSLLHWLLSSAVLRRNTSTFAPLGFCKLISFHSRCSFMCVFYCLQTEQTVLY